MDAVSLLNKHIDVNKLLHHYDFDKVRHDGGFIRACCKLHGGDNPSSFVISEETGLYYCHTSCGGGDIYKLVQKMEDLDFFGAVRWVADFFAVDINDLQIKERQENYLLEMKKFIQTMRKTRKKEISEYVVSDEIKEVTKYRSFQEETLRHFGLGYVESIAISKRDKTTSRLRNRLFFPIFFKGKLIGASLRRVNNQDQPKWLHQPAHIETKEILYNYDAVGGRPQVVVVEGIPDVWAYHEIGIPAVATFGAHLTDEQYRLLMQTGADIILSYDGDHAGQEATKKAIELFRKKARIEKVELFVGEDPENISREQLKLKYDERKRVH